jgi:hypothetical protein
MSEKNANGLTAEQQAKADAWREQANRAYKAKHGFTLDEAEAMAKYMND